MLARMRADDELHLGRALELARRSAAEGGGPFGAVVVRAGRVLGEGANRVTLEFDPTAHAEIVALRAACARERTHDLSGAVLYASCEPCPMCLGAALWARVARVVFAATRDDAAAAGFDDRRFHEHFAHGPLALSLERAEHAHGRAPFEAWLANPQRRPY
jgi:guanine deaminase